MEKPDLSSKHAGFRVTTDIATEFQSTTTCYEGLLPAATLHRDVAHLKQCLVHVRGALKMRCVEKCKSDNTYWKANWDTV